MQFFFTREIFLYLLNSWCSDVFFSLFIFPALMHSMHLKLALGGLFVEFFLYEISIAFNLQILFLLQLHGGMCKRLSNIYCKVLNIFPALEASRPRSRSGIQALCSLHVALEKARNLLQHCSECSKLYLVCLVLVIGFPHI